MAADELRDCTTMIIVVVAEAGSVVKVLSILTIGLSMIECEE